MPYIIVAMKLHAFTYIYSFMLSQYIDYHAYVTGNGGSGLSLGQDHTSLQLMSNLCLQFDVYSIFL